jgi:RHS repeat-associated protein
MTDLDGAHDYLYDQLNQLISATHPQPSNPMENFDYDPVGNRLSAANVYNAANQLLENDSYVYSYDKDGNLREKEDKASGEMTRYTYNAIHQLTDIKTFANQTEPTPITSVHYILDGLGRRIVKNVDGVQTQYIYDQKEVLWEQDLAGNVLAYYTNGPGLDEHIAMRRDGQSYFYVTDALGTVAKLTDASGNVVNEYIYDSYGSMVSKTEAVENPYTYTGRRYDPESGLYYYRSRYYDPDIGRFTQRDFINLDVLIIAGVDITALQANPRLFNYYSYVQNNPLMYVDPEGDFTLTGQMMAVGAVAGGITRATQTYFSLKNRAWGSLFLDVGISWLVGAAEGTVDVALASSTVGLAFLIPYNYTMNKAWSVRLNRLRGWSNPTWCSFEDSVEDAVLDAAIESAVPFAKIASDPSLLKQFFYVFNRGYLSSVLRSIGNYFGGKEQCSQQEGGNTN